MNIIKVNGTLQNASFEKGNEKAIMKIFVVGGSGFGTKLVNKLRKHGRRVIAGTSHREQLRTSSKPMLAMAFLITSILTTNSTLVAQTAVTPKVQETITTLMSKDLAGFPDKEVLMYTVDFPAGFSSPVHRHNAQVSVYALEGSVVMQVRGGKEITLRPGQSFYEGPNDIHVVSRNASATKSAKFLVFLIHKKGAPLVIPAK
jgi:quercetin dioxygenase-like cupin family protein